MTKIFNHLIKNRKSNNDYKRIYQDPPCPDIQIKCIFTRFSRIIIFFKHKPMKTNLYQFLLKLKVFLY